MRAKRTYGLGRALSAGLALALLAGAMLACLAWPVAARAESVEDRVTHVSAEEQDELLAHAKIGSNTGSVAMIYVQKTYPEAEVLDYPSIADGVVALDSGRIEYACVPETMALLYMRNDAKYSYLDAGLFEVDDTFGFAKGNEATRDKISEAIRKLTDDGTLDELYRKWIIDGDYSMDDVPVNEDAPVLKVACPASEEPVIFIKDGQIVGLDVEIAMRAAYEAGYRLEFTEMTFSAELSAVSSGKVDFGLHFAPTEERKKTFCFSEPIEHVRWIVMFVADDSASAGFFDSIADNLEASFVTEGRWQLVANGLALTCAIALGAFALATLGGALLCWLGTRGGAAQAFSNGYVRIVTGIPVLVWLMLLYYVIFAGVDVPAPVVAVLCFGLEASAPLSRVFATGLASVDAGQVEAALALGFSRGEAFRRVVMPQAAAAVWGLYAGQLTSLVKATSIVGYVAINDLTKASDIIRSRTFQAFFPLVCTALIYFAVIALASWALTRAGRRFDPKLRSRNLILRGIKANHE